MPHFDHYLFIDWSADSRPGPSRPRKDKIWTCSGDRHGQIEAPVYFRTRSDAVSALRDDLHSAVSAGERVLVGFDFPFGYPRGLAGLIAPGAEKPPWRRTWEALSALITDDDSNANNRFDVAVELNRRCGPGPGPFWGHPRSYGASPDFTPCRDPFFKYPLACEGHVELSRFRTAESVASGLQEGWKLCYPGSVGGQALVGIPRVLALRDDPELAAHSAVWPFETGFTALPADDRPTIIYAEIWPGLVETELGRDGIRDAQQVREMVNWAQAQDAKGELASYFLGPKDASEMDIAACIAEEGWILGYR